MRIPSMGTRRSIPAVRAAAVWLAWLVFLGPAVLRADESAGAGKRARFHLSLAAGLSLLDPADLNRFVDRERTVQEFTYDSYFEYLRASALIQSWTTTADSKWRRIRNAFPIGLQIRYSLLDFLDVSLGFQFLDKDTSADLHFAYTRNELSGLQYLESLDYVPLSVKVRAYGPSVGIHLSRRLGRLLTAEAYASGGPLFAECSALSHSRYRWTIRGPGYAWDAFSSERVLAESGSGTGIAVELGGRVGLPLFRGCDVFLEGGYAYQVVKSITGSGSEIRDGDMESWEGRWRIRTESMATPWGIRQLSFPSAFPTDETGAGDFRLDLSGARLRIGLSFGF